MEDRRYLGSISKYSDSPINFGGHSNIFKCIDKYTDQFVCYKEFCSLEYMNAIKDTILNLIKMYGNYDYAFPSSIVFDKERCDKGYITDYYEGYISIDDLVLSHEKKLELIKKARELVEKLHKDYKCLHADLAPWNFLYNEYLDHLVLCDFDTSLFMNKDNKINDLVHSVITLNYLKYQKLDEGLDIYLFNLFTYAILNNVNFNDVLYMVRNNKYGVLSDNEKAKKILSSYDELNNGKILKKEYIMDFIN